MFHLCFFSKDDLLPWMLLDSSVLGLTCVLTMLSDMSQGSSNPFFFWPETERKDALSSSVLTSAGFIHFLQLTLALLPTPVLVRAGDSSSVQASQASHSSCAKPGFLTRTSNFSSLLQAEEQMESPCSRTTLADDIDSSLCFIPLTD